MLSDIRSEEENIKKARQRQRCCLGKKVQCIRNYLLHLSYNKDGDGILSHLYFHWPSALENTYTNISPYSPLTCAISNTIKINNMFN